MVEPRFDADASTGEARRALHERNRLSWNEATRAHNSHKGDEARFYREGCATLHPEEAALLGDLSGKPVVHLQCNSGRDTLSIRRLGAAKLLGVDISDEAVTFAQRLSADSGVEASFVRADVYDWLAAAATGDERWDVVFCSYGAIIWLSDLATWARGTAAVLRPEAVRDRGVPPGRDDEHFREYDYCNGFRPYAKMKCLGGRRWTMPDGIPSLPFMYSIVARKPA